VSKTINNNSNQSCTNNINNSGSINNSNIYINSHSGSVGGEKFFNHTFRKRILPIKSLYVLILGIIAFLFELFQTVEPVIQSIHNIFVKEMSLFADHNTDESIFTFVNNCIYSN
jgi:hypothetical protein